MTPEHLGAIIRLFDPLPDWHSWTGRAVSATIRVHGNQLRMDHSGRGKERVLVHLKGGPDMYFDDALVLMAYLERLRE